MPQGVGYKPKVMRADRKKVRGGMPSPGAERQKARVVPASSKPKPKPSRKR